MKLILEFKDTGVGVDVEAKVEGEETATEAERQLCNGFRVFISKKMDSANALLEQIKKAEGN